MNKNEKLLKNIFLIISSKKSFNNVLLKSLLILSFKKSFKKDF